MKGTFQGITGLVVKPVTGLLDATSKVGEGIKNTATSLDDKPNSIWERDPRVFYDKEQFFSDYKSNDAKIMLLLQNIKKGKYAGRIFVDLFTIIPNKKDAENKFILILLVDIIVFFSLKKKKRLWDIDVSNIETIQKFADGIQIKIKIKTKKIKVNYYFFNFFFIYLFQKG